VKTTRYGACDAPDEGIDQSLHKLRVVSDRRGHRSRIEFSWRDMAIAEVDSADPEL
jgi:hypothetical protein